MSQSSDAPELNPHRSSLVPVTLNLPPDLVAIVRQRATQTGQSPTQVIIAALRQGLAPTAEVAPTPDSLAARVAALEALIPQVQALEAAVEQLTQARSHPQPAPPTNASAPSLNLAAPASPPTQPLEQCPRCEHRLGPPLQSSGRQVCSKCGWTNRPRQANPTLTPPVTTELPPDDLQTILAEAAQQSLSNMKPRKPPATPPPKPFPDLNSLK